MQTPLPPILQLTPTHMSLLPLLALGTAVTMLGTALIRPKIRPPMPVPYPYMEDLQDQAPRIDASLFPERMLQDYIPKGRPQAMTAAFDATAPCDVTAADLNRTLDGKLRGQGKTLIRIARKHGLNPLFFAALCAHESANGKSAYAKDHNNVSGQLTYSKSAKRWQPMSFPSVEACLERTAKNLHDNYTTKGRTTVAQIQRKYCPIITDKKSTDFNDPQSVNRFWVSGILKWVSRLERA